MAAIFGKEHLKDGTQAALSDRFMLEIEGLDFALVESVSRPGYKIETEAFQLMEYKFNFPKRVEYDNTIDLVIIELLDPEISLTQMENVMSRLLNNNFYTTPSGIREPKNPFIGQPKAVGGVGVINQGSTNNTFNLSKEALTDALSMGTRSSVVIHTLDADGRKYESMRLSGAMVTNVKFSGLKYSSSDINKITLTLTFDYVDFGRNGNYNYGGTYDKFRGTFPQLDSVLRDAVNKKLKPKTK
jgi:hypothetical protein